MPRCPVAIEELQKEKKKNEKCRSGKKYLRFKYLLGIP